MRNYNSSDDTTYIKALQKVGGILCFYDTGVPLNRLATKKWSLMRHFAIVLRTGIQLHAPLRSKAGRKKVYFAPFCCWAMGHIISMIPHHDVVMLGYGVVKLLSGSLIIYCVFEKVEASLNSR